MEYGTLNISQLNDFVFCPYSIYLHNVYQNLDDDSYHDTPQIKGRVAHESVDSGKYSTRKSVLTNLSVYSERYGLLGKIDQYFVEGGRLIERKRTIRTIYDGYKLQLYAQYFCLVEMGFGVEYVGFYSMTDNKNYALPLPDDEIVRWFENYLTKIRKYNPLDSEISVNPNKCAHCIYQPLCDKTN